MIKINFAKDVGMEEEDDVIPLPNVSSAILKKVKIFDTYRSHAVNQSFN